MIERFTYFERAAHWTNAIAFCVLAISGLVMAFGKFFLLPLIGGALFGWLTYALKTAHNFVGPLFAVSLVIVFLTFVRSNLPSRDDLRWLREGRRHVRRRASRRRTASTPARRWSSGAASFVLGVIVVGSGLVLDKLRARASTTCAATCRSRTWCTRSRAMLMMALFLGHIYIGTIGMQRRLPGDEDRLRRRRLGARAPPLWYDDIARRQDPGAAQPRRRAPAAEQPAA